MGEKKTNIWDNFDFKGMQKEVDTKVKVKKSLDKDLNDLFKEYVAIIKEEFYKAYQDTLKISIDVRSERIHINFVLDGGSRMSFETIFTTKDGKYCLFGFHDELPYAFDDKPMFRNYIRQMIIKNGHSFIKKLYKQNAIKELPKILVSSKPKINLSNITSDKFKSIFESLSESEMNGETVEDISITKEKSKVVVMFSIDCGRSGLHRGCTLTANDRGDVSVDMYDTPLEGSGVDSGLEEDILKLITTTNE